MGVAKTPQCETQKISRSSLFFVTVRWFDSTLPPLLRERLLSRFLSVGRLIKKKGRIFNPGMRAFADRQYRIRRSSAQRRSIRGKLGRKTWRRLVSHFLTNCRRVRRFSEVPWKYCFRRSKYRRPTSGRLGPISGQRIEVVDPPRVSTILSLSPLFHSRRCFSPVPLVSPSTLPQDF